MMNQIYKNLIRITFMLGVEGKLLNQLKHHSRLLLIGIQNPRTSRRLINLLLKLRYHALPTSCHIVISHPLVLVMTFYSFLMKLTQPIRECSANSLNISGRIQSIRLYLGQESPSVLRLARKITSKRNLREKPLHLGYKETSLVGWIWIRVPVILMPPQKI